MSAMQDSRSDYYNKWSQVANETTAATLAEEEDEKEKAAAALGSAKYPSSAAEAESIEKRAALKEAKKKWVAREKEEAAAKCALDGLSGETREVTPAELAGKRVLVVSNCTDCHLTLPAALGMGEGEGYCKLIKLFVENCTRVTLTLHCRLLTSFVEVAHCDDVTLDVRAVLHTVQADVCDGVTVRYEPAAFDGALVPGTDARAQLYHAGCKRVAVDAGRGRTAAADYVADGAVARGSASAEETQFVTRLAADGTDALVTERVVRAGNRWLTESEATASSLPPDEAAAAAAAGDAAPSLGERDALAEANEAKQMGNDSFAAGEHAQAAVHYTVALEREHPQPEVIYANRAACFLKLGHHDKALADADACLAAAPTNVKGHFRRGLALHALGRWREALPSLGRASELDPKNKQIKEAIKFAEYRLQQDIAKHSGAA